MRRALICFPESDRCDILWFFLDVNIGWVMMDDGSFMMQEEVSVARHEFSASEDDTAMIDSESNTPSFTLTELMFHAEIEDRDWSRGNVNIRSIYVR